MKRMFTAILTAVMLISITIPYAAAVNTASGPKEVFMEPEQIDENTFVYRDENGEIVATQVLLDETDESMPVTRATVYGAHWTLAPSRYEHDTKTFDARNNIYIYYHVDFSRSGDSYAGYYDHSVDTYRWLGDPVSYGMHGWVLIGGSSAVSFAIKNASNSTITYDARYSTAPFDV